jgi:hypothetical protein
MKPEELHAPQGDWRAADSHLRAVEQRRAMESWSADVPLTNRDGPVLPTVDEHREAARALLERAVKEHEPLGHAECERANAAYEERRRNAEMQVRLADRLGEEVDPQIRALASTPSAQESVDRILAQRAADRAAALKQTIAPVTGRNDGSRPPLIDGSDPYGWALEGQRTIGQFPQVQRHQQMAEGKVPDLRTRRRRGR